MPSVNVIVIGPFGGSATTAAATGFEASAFALAGSGRLSESNPGAVIRVSEPRRSTQASSLDWSRPMTLPRMLNSSVSTLASAAKGSSRRVALAMTCSKASPTSAGSGALTTALPGSGGTSSKTMNLDVSAPVLNTSTAWPETSVPLTLPAPGS